MGVWGGLRNRVLTMALSSGLDGSFNHRALELSRWFVPYLVIIGLVRGFNAGVQHSGDCHAPGEGGR